MDEQVVSWMRDQLAAYSTFVGMVYVAGSTYETLETTDDGRVIFTAYNVGPGEERILPKLPENKRYEFQLDADGQNRAVVVTDFYVGD